MLLKAQNENLYLMYLHKLFYIPTYRFCPNIKKNVIKGTF